MSSIIDHYQAEYKKHWVKKTGYPSLDLHNQHSEALLQFSEMGGLPHPKNEHWRYIAQEPLIKQPFSFISNAQGVALHKLPALLNPASIRLVFINGFFIDSLSTAQAALAGLRFESFPQAGGTQTRHKDIPINSFSALNSAFSTERMLLEVAEGTCCESPIELLFLTNFSQKDIPTLVMTPMNNQIKVGANSQVSFVERHALIGQAKDNAMVLGNIMTELSVNAGAQVNWYTHIQGNHHSGHIGQLVVLQQQNSHVNLSTLNYGGALTRRTNYVALQAIHAACTIKGINVTHQKQLVDHQVTVLHQAPHTESETHYRMIASDQSRAAFEGEVKIAPEIFKIKARQNNHNLILSDEAEIDTRPQLAIFSDDVACSHGATVGQLDEEALFYLKSRGLTSAQARAMLVHAFTQVMLKEMPLFNKSAVQSDLYALITEISNDLS